MPMVDNWTYKWGESQENGNSEQPSAGTITLSGLEQKEYKSKQKLVKMMTVVAEQDGKP